MCRSGSVSDIEEHWSADTFVGMQLHSGVGAYKPDPNDDTYVTGFRTVTLNFGMHLAIGWER